MKMLGIAQHMLYLNGTTLDGNLFFECIMIKTRTSYVVETIDALVESRNFLHHQTHRESVPAPNSGRVNSSTKLIYEKKLVVEHS